MKLIAYISIFLIVHSNVIFAGERAARALRDSVIRRQISKKPQPETRGRQWNPYVNDPSVIPVASSSGEEATNKQSKITNEDSSSSTSIDSNNSNPGLDLIAKMRLPNGNGAGKGPGAGAQSKGGDLDRKLPGAPNGGNSSGGGSEGQSFGKWWPVCIFVDSKSPDANKQIKEMVDMAAACSVNLVPHIRRVDIASPNDEKAINAEQRKGCNLEESGTAPKGSTLVLTDQSDTVADEMCGITEEREYSGPGKKPPSTSVAGCNELASGGGSADDQKKWEGAAKNDGKGDGFGGVSNGSVAVGIVDKKGYSDGKVYSHEAQGHGQFGWPNGSRAGNGIKNPNDKDDTGGEGSPGNYLPPGCARMVATALDDPKQVHKYYRDKTSPYYNVEAPPIPLGTPIFPKQGPGREQPNPNNEPPKQIVRGSLDKPPSSPVAGGSTLPLATAGAGHKKPAGQVSNRGTEVRSGDTNTESGRVANRGGDVSPDTAGSAVTGSGAAPEGNKMIVANKSEKPEEGDSNSGSLNSDFFADSPRNYSGNSGLGIGGVSSTDSGFSETQTASIVKNKNKTGYGGLNDTDFWAKSTPPEIKELKPKRNPARVYDPQNPQVAGSGTTPNRTPSSSNNSLNRNPSRALRNQVGFEGGS